MGLKEKRFLNDAKTQWVPRYQQQLKDEIGLEIAYEIDAPTFENDFRALELLENQGFVSMNNVLTMRIGCDDVGKEALQGIKKIVLRNIDNPDNNGVKVADGVMTYEAAWGKDSYLPESYLQEAIEQAL